MTVQAVESGADYSSSRAFVSLSLLSSWFRWPAIDSRSWVRGTSAAPLGWFVCSLRRRLPHWPPSARTTLTPPIVRATGTRHASPSYPSVSLAANHARRAALVSGRPR